MSAVVYESFEEAYRESVKAVIEHGDWCAPVLDVTSVGSNFGRSKRGTKELVSFKFSVKNPRARMTTSEVRKTPMVFNHANLIWTISGGNDVGMISSYNERGLVFAKNQAFYEAAFGARLFYPYQQIRLVEKRLRSDPASRRAIAMIYIPEDTQIDKLDTPCATYLHFMIRDNKLICICNMRSQSAFMILPYDFFLFSMIHEILATRLGLELGHIDYVSNSFHIYEDELEVAGQFVDESYDSAHIEAMSPMEFATDDLLASLVSTEQLIRLNKTLRYPSDIEDGLDCYWKSFVDVIYRHWESKS